MKKISLSPLMYCSLSRDISIVSSDVGIEELDMFPADARSINPPILKHPCFN